MTSTPDPRAIEATIDQELGETQSVPNNQIRSIVQRLGPVAARAILP